MADAVNDLGMDPNGNNPIDAALDSALTDGATIEFPPGDYLVTEEHRHFDLQGVTIRGTGSSMDDVRFVFPDGNAGSRDPANYQMFDFDGCDDITLENFQIHQTNDATTAASIVLWCENTFTIKDVHWQGYNPIDSHAMGNCFYPSITTASGEGVIDGIVIDGGGIEDTYPHRRAGMTFGALHTGHVVVRNLLLEELGSSGLRVGAGPGTVEVHSSTFRNVDNACLRFAGGADGSSEVHHCLFEYDANKITSSVQGGGFETPDCVRFDAHGDGRPGALVRDCQFNVLSYHPNTQPSAPLTSPGWAETDSYTVRNCNFVIDESVRVLNATGGPATIDACSVGGTGTPSTLFACSSGGTVQNTCVSLDWQSTALDGLSDAGGNTFRADSGSCPNVVEGGVGRGSEPGLPGDTPECSTDVDCAGGHVCVDGSCEPMHTIAITGMGTATMYSFSVTGTLSGINNSIESFDTVNESSAEGWVTESTHTDEYAFTGTIDSFTILQGGPLSVEINGEVHPTDDVVGEPSQDTDPCAGVTCPDGQECVEGECVPIDDGSDPQGGNSAVVYAVAGGLALGYVAKKSTEK